MIFDFGFILLRKRYLGPREADLRPDSGMVVLGGLPLENASKHAFVDLFLLLLTGILIVNDYLDQIWKNALHQSFSDGLAVLLN